MRGRDAAGGREAAPGPAGIEDLHATLRRRILEEAYFPGQKLSENTLAREFGCSRTPVREALKRLENENLIEVRPQSGTYVKEATGRDYAELLEVRAYIEGLAYRLAVERADEAGIASLAELCLAMDGAVAAIPMDMQRYADLHYRFHHLLVELAGNALLVRMFERLNLRASHMFIRTMNVEGSARTQEEHHRILRDLSRRDRKGEKFVVDHLWRRKSSLDY